jgi:hypothetical protein
MFSDNQTKVHHCHDVKLRPAHRACCPLARVLVAVLALPWTCLLHVLVVQVRLAAAAADDAKQALALSPQYDLAHHLMGRWHYGKTAVATVMLTARYAAKAQRVYPQSPLRLHVGAEMAGLNAMVRTLVRVLYGATLMSGSYQQALVHFRTACELAPDMLIHRVEYGECAGQGCCPLQPASH